MTQHVIAGTNKPVNFSLRPTVTRTLEILVYVKGKPVRVSPDSNIVTKGNVKQFWFWLDGKAILAQLKGNTWKA